MRSAAANATASAGLPVPCDSIWIDHTFRFSVNSVFRRGARRFSGARKSSSPNTANASSAE